MSALTFKVKIERERENESMSESVRARAQEREQERENAYIDSIVLKLEIITNVYTYVPYDFKV